MPRTTEHGGRSATRRIRAQTDAVPGAIAADRAAIVSGFGAPHFAPSSGSQSGHDQDRTPRYVVFSSDGADLTNDAPASPDTKQGPTATASAGGDPVDASHAPMPTTRIRMARRSIQMSPDVEATLDFLKAKTAARSDTQVFQRSLQIFETLIRYQERGIEVFVKSPGNEQLTRILIV